MEVLIFTECPNEDYFRALFHLQKQKKITVQFVDSRSFYLFFLKVYSSSSLLRTFGHRYFRKPLNVPKISWKDVYSSFGAYVTLPFTRKKIVALFAPYYPVSMYLCFLSFLGKDITFMTSWPYWGGEYVHKPKLFSRFFWKKFLTERKIVTISSTAKKSLDSLSPSVVQIPHAVDLKLFYPGKKKKFQVLFVGRIIPEKGISGMLDSARELPEVPFVFVGQGSAVSLIQNCGLKNVSYLGEIRDREKLAQLFRESSVFVLNSYAIPGWEELYGIVLLEALASGTAVISTDCVGPKEIVRKEFGFLIPQKNTIAMKAKILWCSTHQKELVSMGLRGRKFVEENYDIEILSEKWKKVLQ